jgi:hypothetical protein
MARITKKNAEKMVWSWGGVEEGKLPLGLGMFRKEELMTRWGKLGRGGGGVVGDGDGERRMGGEGRGRRVWEGDQGEVEMGMGFGETGGFDTIDYSVPPVPPLRFRLLH